MGGGDDDITYYNPGSIDMADQNPDIYRETENLRSLRTRFRDGSTYALDPARYNSRMMEAGNRASVAVENQMANYGMAGSSAGVGAASEARRLNNFAWDDRMINDQIRALQVEAALSGQISGNILQVQDRYANMQNQVIGAQQQSNANEAALWASIIGAAGTVAGAAVAGPGGAMVGSQLGGMAGGAYANSQTPVYQGGTGGYSVGNSFGMYGGGYGGNPGAYGYGG